MTLRRVVVTGMGLVTPFGVGTQFNWQQITSGACAIKSLMDPVYKQMPCKVAGLIPRGNEEHELSLETFFTASELRTISPGTAFALVAAAEALQDARWKPEETNSLERTGVAIGMGMVDLDDIQTTGKALEKRYSQVSPYFVPRILTNMPTGQVSMKYGFQGPNHSVSTACATGCHAIGDAFRMIRNDDADVMVCGGTEAAVTPLGIAGFCRLRALSTRFNDTPEAASRPFDVQRDGFVMGEGAGIVVLEEYEHALKRKANIYAEVIGYGLSGDAHHITSPRTDGAGATLAMKRALQEAKIDLCNVGYINAHATSTPRGDEIEAQAIETLFGTHSQNLMVSSTKGAVGHLLGAAGAVEAIFTILACHAAYVPPTINLNEPSPDLDLDFVPHEAKPWVHTKRLRVALSNSFGFGGTNASICIFVDLPSYREGSSIRYQGGIPPYISKANVTSTERSIAGEQEQGIGRSFSFGILGNVGNE